MFRDAQTTNYDGAVLFGPLEHTDLDMDSKTSILLLADR